MRYSLRILCAGLAALFGAMISLPIVDSFNWPDWIADPLPTGIGVAFAVGIYDLKFWKTKE